LTSEDIRATLRTQTAPPRNSLLINWGNREPAYSQEGLRVINPLPLVDKVACKLRFFRHVGASTYVPLWTTDLHKVEEWLKDHVVVVRKKTAASGGEGIEIIEGRNTLIPVAPLYTVYQKKTAEYRLHMFKDVNTNEWQPRIVQRKLAIKDENGNHKVTDWRVRNHTNGFIFNKQPIEETSKRVIDCGIGFMKEHFNDLHFLALDIIDHSPTKTTLVLEGNSAPGLEGTTLDTYVEYFKEVAK